MRVVAGQISALTYGPTTKSESTGAKGKTLPTEFTAKQAEGNYERGIPEQTCDRRLPDLSFD
jgi:hypothetical protein